MTGQQNGVVVETAAVSLSKSVCSRVHRMWHGFTLTNMTLSLLKTIMMHLCVRFVDRHSYFYRYMQNSTYEGLQLTCSRLKPPAQDGLPMATAATHTNARTLQITGYRHHVRWTKDDTALNSIVVLSISTVDFSSQCFPPVNVEPIPY